MEPTDHQPILTTQGTLPIPKGHHQRGYLPHRDYGGSIQAITFRLVDSLPVQVIEKWKTELHLSDEENQKEVTRRIAHYEDAGHGNCHLRRPEVAKIVQDSILKGHNADYKLIAWCIMPNHVHVLIDKLNRPAWEKLSAVGKAAQPASSIFT